jgi:hypothetical protein
MRLRTSPLRRAESLERKVDIQLDLERGRMQEISMEEKKA